VRVERRPVDRALNQSGLGKFEGGVNEVTETAEVPVVAEVARVVEEVVIGKDLQERTETVRDTVRRADIDVKELPTEKGMGKSNPAAE